MIKLTWFCEPPVLVWVNIDHIVRVEPCTNKGYYPRGAAHVYVTDGELVVREVPERVLQLILAARRGRRD